MPLHKRYHIIASELFHFNLKRESLIISAHVAFKSNPVIWPVLQENLISNKLTLSEFTEILMDCLLSFDNLNSISSETDLEKTYSLYNVKLDRGTFSNISIKTSNF